MIVMIWCFFKSYLTVNLRFYGFDALIKELIWIILVHGRGTPVSLGFPAGEAEDGE